MKRILMFVALMALAGEAWCAWQGKLDLNSSVQPLIMREAHDGQWLAGIAHPNMFHVDHNGNIIFHAGVFNAWNSGNGNASFGPLVGLDLTGISKEIGCDVPFFLGKVADATNLPNTFKPAIFFVSMLSIDAFAGYRPFHTADVNGPFVYGVAASLSIPFTIQELKAGL